jgi:hypothetical protein
MKAKPRLLNTPAPAALGAIHRDEVLPFAVAAARLGWCAKSRRFSQRDGLRVVRYGRHQYVLGTDVLDFFRKLAGQQAGAHGQEGKADV